MESLYRDALHNLRQGADSINDLFSMTWSYTKLNKPSEVSAELEKPQVVAESVAKVQTPSSPEAPTSPSPEVAPEEKAEITEKAKLLDSLYQFGNDKLEEVSPAKTYNFKGGELAKKPSAAQVATPGRLHSLKGLDGAQIVDEITKELGSEVFAKRFEASNPFASGSEEGTKKVLFITDSLCSTEEITQTPFEGQLSVFFSGEVYQLFARMIKAMNLGEDDFYVSSVNKGETYSDESCKDLLLEEIFYLKPQVLISLGAQATTELLGVSERLKNIHGQFFDLKFEDSSGTIKNVELMPLFSPKLLQTAPNMKKTAWKDMQKVMEKLGL